MYIDIFIFLNIYCSNISRTIVYTLRYNINIKCIMMYILHRVSLKFIEYV